MTSRKADKLMLRMPDDMRPKLKALAAMNRRSLNSEVIFHLERALSKGVTAATGEVIGVPAPAAASFEPQAGKPANSDHIG